jgi:hypothetical protein
MIFRNSNGNLVEINKYDYPNDQIYYEKVMKLYEEFTKYNHHDKNIKCLLFLSFNASLIKIF